jgi:ferredoxin--NADP+ reductase
MILRVKPQGEVPEFHPGQYVALGLFPEAPRPAHFPPEREACSPGKLIKRAYSIGSSPQVREYLEFYIAIVPEGALTSRLALVKEGDQVFLAPKITGTFTLQDVPTDSNLVLVSTGTGIAPFMAMLRTPGTWSPGRRITVVHGVRYPKDLAYRDELTEFTSRGLRYFPIVSREDPTSPWTGERGHLQRLFEKGLIPLDPQKDHVYLCGNPAMIDDMEKLLLSQGYVVHSRKTPGSLHLEKYW